MAPAPTAPRREPRVRAGVRFDLSGAADLAAACRALIDGAVRSDALGLDVAWIGERAGSALALCAAAAARTSRLRVATAVVPLPLVHPVRVAEDAATVDGISDGRLELGIGLGADAERARGYGLGQGERGVRLEEALAVMRAAWSDAALDHAGPFHRFEGVDVHPKPVQRGGPPLWLGVRSGAGAARAARLGLGVLTASRDAAGAFLDAWRREGRSPGDARVALELAPLADDLEAARAQCRAALDDLAGAGRVDLVMACPLDAGGPSALERFAEARPREDASILGRPGPHGR